MCSRVDLQGVSAVKLALPVFIVSRREEEKELLLLRSYEPLGKLYYGTIMKI